MWCILVCVRAFGCVCGVAIGCTNNNYASREKCKKCGQPKEVAALSALAIPGAASHLSYFTTTRGPDPANQASAVKEWRSGDWICTCGFHNYSSRIQVASKWVLEFRSRHFFVYSFLFCVMSMQCKSAMKQLH